MTSAYFWPAPPSGRTFFSPIWNLDCSQAFTFKRLQRWALSNSPVSLPLGKAMAAVSQIQQYLPVSVLESFWNGRLAFGALTEDNCLTTNRSKACALMEGLQKLLLIIWKSSASIVLFCPCFPIKSQGDLASSLPRLTPVMAFIQETYRNGRGVMSYNISWDHADVTLALIQEKGTGSRWSMQRSQQDSARLVPCVCGVMWARAKPIQIGCEGWLQKIMVTFTVQLTQANVYIRQEMKTLHLK